MGEQIKSEPGYPDREITDLTPRDVGIVTEGDQDAGSSIEKNQTSSSESQ